MDEATLRTQVCQAAQQLWMRGLLVADHGMVTAEVHRRRFLATPQGKRRADLRPDDLFCVDVGGQNIDGEGSLDEADWLPHRIAYRLNQQNAGPDEVVAATVLANPPITTGLIRLSKDTNTLQLDRLPPAPMLQADDEAGIEDALGQYQLIALCGQGILAVGKTLTAAINRIECLEHAARIHLVTRSG